MRTKVDKVVERLRATSIQCFIKYFEIFQASKNERSNDTIINAFSQNNEIWTRKSYQSRASKGKAIFRDNQEVDALTYIIDSNNKGKVSIEIIEKAEVLLSKILN